MTYMGEAVHFSKVYFAPPNAIAHAGAMAGHRSCDVENGRRERPVIVPDNTGIPYFHVSRINGAPRITNHATRITTHSFRQRIRPRLNVNDQRLGSLAAFFEPGGAIAARDPKSAALPTDFCIVDAALQSLHIKTERIRNAQCCEFSVYPSMHAIEKIAGDNREIFAKAECVVLVHPRVVTRLHTELRKLGKSGPGQIVKGPAFGTVIAGGLRSIQRCFAFATIEFTELPTGERHPDDALAIDVGAAYAETGQ